MTRYLIILTLCCFAADAQINSDQIVKVESTKVTVKTGSGARVDIPVDVKSGYHIQASNVKDEYLIPTTLELTQQDGILASEIIFPQTKQFKLEGTDEFLDVFDGRFEIKVALKTEKGTKKGLYTLNGKLKYQACDSVRCLFPRTVEFLINVDVR